MNPSYSCPVRVYRETFFDYAGNEQHDTLVLVLEDGSRQRLSVHEARGVVLALSGAVHTLRGKSCE